MSAVINKAKRHYLKALRTELSIIITGFLLLTILKGYVSVSFLIGSLAIFLPHCLFVYWIFFKKPAENHSKLSAFYQGEGIKWFVTILMVIAGLKLVPDLQIGPFLVGYIVTLLLNNIVPFVLSKCSN